MANLRPRAEPIESAACPVVVKVPERSEVESPGAKQSEKSRSEAGTGWLTPDETRADSVSCLCRAEPFSVLSGQNPSGRARPTRTVGNRCARRVVNTGSDWGSEVLHFELHVASVRRKVAAVMVKGQRPRPSRGHRYRRVLLGSDDLIAVRGTIMVVIVCA